MPLTRSEGLSWQRRDQPDPGEAQTHPHGGLCGLPEAQSIVPIQQTCPKPLPHAGVCFIPVLSELNSPMLFPRRERGLEAPGEERGEEGEESTSNVSEGYKWVSTRRKSCCPVRVRWEGWSTGCNPSRDLVATPRAHTVP